MGVKGKRFFDRSFSDRSFFDRSWSKGSKLRASAKAAVPLISVFALGACSIHPVQQDVTGLPVVKIMNHIRCETRVAIQRKAIELLRKVHHDTRLADTLEQHLGEIWRVNPYTELNAVERAFYFRYINTGIAYDFTFDITEDNKATLAADPVRLITNGTAGVGLNSSGEFSRDNIRKFTVTDTFEKLLYNNIPDCYDRPTDPNFAYPVAGSIGMFELISTFVDLNEDDALQPIPSGSGVFGDQLMFVTTLMGSVTPSVQISPVGHKWGLATPTSFGATATRTDKHTLNIGLSMSTDKAKPTEAGPASLGPTSALSTTSALHKTSGTTSTEKRALAVVTQQRWDTFLDRFGTVVVPAQ
jgi:hypothetical protein